MTGLTTRQKALKLKEGLLCQAYNVACNCGTTYEVAAGRSAPEDAPAEGDMVQCVSCDCWSHQKCVGVEAVDEEDAQSATTVGQLFNIQIFT